MSDIIKTTSDLFFANRQYVEKQIIMQNIYGKDILLQISTLRNFGRYRGFCTGACLNAKASAPVHVLLQSKSKPPPLFFTHKLGRLVS